VRCRLLLFALLTSAVLADDAPKVTFQAVPEQKTLDTHQPLFEPATTDPLPVSLVILNNSDKELRDVEMLVPSKQFRASRAVTLPRTIPPFGSVTGRVVLQPAETIGYGHKDAVLILLYGWTATSGPVVSAQSATVGADIKQPFEDEAKGLPGGTAALFALLLPVFPAFFAYQIVDRLRKGEGFQVPTFGSEYVFPAFFIGLLANSLGLRYSRGVVLIGAVVLGALWPLLRWLWEWYQQARWAFDDTDSDAEYLRKALLAPGAPRRFLRVSGKAGGQTWTGVRLAQPDGELVLGPQLQVTPADPTQWIAAETLVKSINAGAGKRERRQLVEGVRANVYKLKHDQEVQQGGKNLSGVAVAGLAGFAEEAAVRVDLLKAIS
jgi:hypothetical protein